MKFKFFVLILFVLTTIFNTHGMSKDTIDADFIKKHGIRRYKDGDYSEYHYVQPYNFLNLTWFTRTHKLKEYSSDKHTLLQDPITYCLKTKLFITSIILPTAFYAGYTFWKKFKK